MFECLQSAVFKLYQRNLVEKAERCRDTGLSSIDEYMNKGDFDLALRFYDRTCGEMSVVGLLGLMSPYEIGVWRNALESRLDLINKAKRYDRRHYVPPEKGRSK